MKKTVAVAVLLFVLASLFPVPAAGAETDVDIGCYEYGYTRASNPNNPRPGYNHFGGGGTVYFVSTSGDDTAGDGSEERPWRTLAHAASQVAAAGSVIRLAAGVYDESAKTVLAPGVSIEGAGDGSSTGEAVTAICTTLLPRLYPGTETWEVPNSIVELVSEANTNGNQHISGVRFEGDYGDAVPNAGQAIEVRNRNNVRISDCTFVNFASCAVGWRSTLINVSTGAGTYAKGGSFNDNVVTNCAGFNTSQEYYFGALFCGGLDGLLIYDNYMVEGQRDAGKPIATGHAENGVPIKFWYYDGWMTNCKIFGNHLEKSWIPRFSGNLNGWPFAIESNRHAGLEIYDNTIVGTIDLNYGFTSVNGKTYSYATHIHDNTLGPAAWSTMTYDGICLEYTVKKTVIERNVVRNCCPALMVNPRNTEVSDLTVRYNEFSEIRALRDDWHQDGIVFTGCGVLYGTLTPVRVSNLNIYNNVFQGESAQENQQARYAINFERDSDARFAGENINIANNIITGFGYWWGSFAPNAFRIGSFTAISGLKIENNLLYGNANNNWLIAGDSAPSNYVSAGNLLGVDPGFVSGTNFRLRSTSPAINAGKSQSASRLADLDNNPAPYIAAYTISYNGNGGVGGMQSATASAGAGFTLPACGFTAPEGKRFKEWAVDSAEGERLAAGTTHVFTQSTVLFAVWEDASLPVTYTVSYNGNGGTGSMQNATATAGAGFTLPACGFTAPSGKRFKEWAVGSAEGERLAAGATHVFTQNTVLFAVWEDVSVPATYTVSYDANGGTGSMTDGTATAGEGFTLPACGFAAPDGKWFRAWAVGSAEGERLAAGGTRVFTQSAVLFAVWEDASSDPPASGNVIYGIADAQTFVKGSDVTFTAGGGGMNNESPREGDRRWLPAAWKTDVSGSFGTGFTQSFSVSDMSVGAHTLTVTFVQQRYDGAAWRETGVQDTKSVGFIVRANPRQTTVLMCVYGAVVALLAAGIIVLVRSKRTDGGKK